MTSFQIFRGDFFCGWVKKQFFSIAIIFTKEFSIRWKGQVCGYCSLNKIIETIDIDPEFLYKPQIFRKENKQKFRGLDQFFKYFAGTYFRGWRLFRFPSELIFADDTQIARNPRNLIPAKIYPIKVRSTLILVRMVFPNVM